MREIRAGQVTQTVRDLCIEANRRLPEDLCRLIGRAGETERSPVGREVLADLSANLKAAETLGVPVCQDTGMAVVFLEVGQEVHFAGGSLYEAVNRGVSLGYTEGGLRCSIVADPFERINTGDNTPAVIHTQIVPGDALRITVAPKGFGSENMSAMQMFTPAAGRDEIIRFVQETVDAAGSKPCPPVIVGVGIGGDFEYAALLAKKALLRPLDQPNAKPFYRQMEEDMLLAVNSLGIGPQGFGGTVTALGVNIEAYPTHIAGLPVAVNMGCHVTRHRTAVL
jgi:fumarate hydratase subunit alpha